MRPAWKPKVRFHCTLMSTGNFPFASGPARRFWKVTQVVRGNHMNDGSQEKGTGDPMSSTSIFLLSPTGCLSPEICLLKALSEYLWWRVPGSATRLHAARSKTPRSNRSFSHPPQQGKPTQMAPSPSPAPTSVSHRTLPQSQRKQGVHGTIPTHLTKIHTAGDNRAPREASPAPRVFLLQNPSADSKCWETHTGIHGFSWRQASSHIQSYWVTVRAICACPYLIMNVSWKATDVPESTPFVTCLHPICWRLFSGKPTFWV